MKIKNLSLPFLAFLQATGLLIYICLVSSIMINGGQIFGNVPTIYAPLAFLLLFIISAVISCLLVLGRAGMLFWDKRYREAFSLISWTLFWSTFYLICVSSILILFK